MVRYVMVNVVKLLRGARYVQYVQGNGARGNCALWFLKLVVWCTAHSVWGQATEQRAAGALCYGYCGEIVVLRDSMVAGNGGSAGQTVYCGFKVVLNTCDISVVWYTHCSGQRS